MTYTITITCPSFTDLITLLYYVDYIQSIKILDCRNGTVTLGFKKP